MKDSRVSVMSIDIDLANSRSWRIVTLRMRIVADDWHHNSGIVGLVNYILHVWAIGEGYTVSTERVLILWLKENDWTAIGDLSFSHGSSHVFHVAGSHY